MAYPTVRPNDPLDQPSHSGLHNQHATDLEALQAFRELFAGGDAGEVLAKTSNSDFDMGWLPGGTGGGPGGDYPGISSEDPNGLGLGTDGGLRVEPADLLSDNEGQQLKVAADDGKLHMAYDILDAVPEDDDTTYSIGDVVFVTGPGDGGSSPVGGGKVLQVVRATDTSRRTSNSTNWVDVNGMSVTITPTKSDSQIMLFFSHRLATTGGSLNVAYVRITDSSGTPITGAENVLWGQNDTTTGRFQSTMVAYATPFSTNPVTYKLQNKANSGSTVEMYNDQSTAMMIAIEVSA